MISSRLSMFDELAARLEIKREESGARRAAGWTELGRGVCVPPGWVWAGDGDPALWVAELSKKGDAVCNAPRTFPPARALPR